MYHRLDLLSCDVQWLVDNHYLVYMLSATDWHNKDMALRAIYEALNLRRWPDYNLDGFNDDLSDLVIPDESGVVVVLQRFDAFAVKQSQAAQALLDIFADNARTFMLFGKRLIILIQTDDPHLKFDPVGAISPDWNRGEWLHARRTS